MLLPCRLVFAEGLPPIVVLMRLAPLMSFAAIFRAHVALFEIFVCSGVLASLTYGASLTYRSRGAEGVAHFAYLCASQLVAFLAYMVVRKVLEGFLIARVSNYWPQPR